jgi:hypothetical protein
VNGSDWVPGDCVLTGHWPTGLQVTVMDLDDDGASDILAYHPVTGTVTRYYVRNLGGCDWSDL